MTPPLAERRSTAEADLEALERAGGAALLDGSDFDPVSLVEARGRLHLLDAAESEASRRAREAEEAEALRLRIEAAVEAKVELAGFLAAATSASELASELAAQLKVIQIRAKALRALSPRIGVRAPMLLDSTHLTKALSLALGESLAGVERPRSFGYLDWPSSPARQGWDVAIREIPETFEPLIQGLTQ